MVRAVDGAHSNSRVAFEQQRRGFKLFSAAKEFVKGWDCYNAYDFRGALKSFKRVAELDPDNPYAHAYLLFAMEDSGDYTIRQLADRAALWHSTAAKYKYQGMDSLAMMHFSTYIKKLEPVENGVVGQV